MVAWIAASAILVALYVLIYYNFLKGVQCRSDTSLRGKTVIVTGANTGLGKETALDMARRGARVILACRSKQRAEEAILDIRKKSGNNKVIFMQLDLASLKSVRAFAETFLKSEPMLHVLINNAGTGGGGKTADGFSMAWGVNHFGHFILTRLLLDRLKQSAPSRIVVLASVAYRIGKIDFSNLNTPVEGAVQQLRNYGCSKLCNILFARELANCLEGTNVTCYSVHPGRCSSLPYIDNILQLRIDMGEQSQSPCTTHGHLLTAGCRVSVGAAIRSDGDGVWQIETTGEKNDDLKSAGRMKEKMQSFQEQTSTHKGDLEEPISNMGFVNTEVFRDLRCWQKVLFVPIAALFFQSPADGAQTSIYCAVEEGIEKFSGRYFADCKVQEVLPHARDDAMARKLWEFSERMVGLCSH